MTATIELNSARRKLQSALGDNSKSYFAHMKAWFRKRCTKEEFDVEAKKLLTADNSHLHNEFLLAILNKCQTLANFTLMTSPTVKSSMPSVMSPTTSIGSPGGPSGFILNRPAPETGDGGRLKVGAIKRKNKTNRPTFDQRFQPASPESLPDCDDFEPYDPDERSLLFAFKEPTLPDATVVSGRLLIAAWDEGLDGSINDPAATDLVVAAVDQFLRRIITSILMDRSGYKLYANKVPYAIGTPSTNPYLINKQRSICSVSSEAPIRSTPEILESLNFTSMTNNVDPLVPVGRFHEKESEHAAMWELACAHKDSKSSEPKVITLYDLLSTLKKHRTLIPSHTVYSINMERLLCRLNHEGHSD